MNTIVMGRTVVPSIVAAVVGLFTGVVRSSEIVDWARDDPASDTILKATPFILGQRKPADPLYNRAAMRSRA